MSEIETWVLVRIDRAPIIGEIRYVRKSMGTRFQEVIWDGKEWIEIKIGEPA